MTDSGNLTDNEDEPVFSTPWQARAFALVSQLAAQNRLDWNEWAQQLGASIKADELAHGADNGERYYEIWLQALESIVLEKQWLNPREIEQRRLDWEQAYRHTEHGKPVELKR